MFNLFKKIANYFTPLDEEAEVERAAATSTVVKSDDEDTTTPATSDKKRYRRRLAPADQRLESHDITTYPDVASLDSTKKRRSVRTYNSSEGLTQKKKSLVHPGEGRFKVELGPTAHLSPYAPATTTQTTPTTVKKGRRQKDDGFRMYDIYGNPSFRASAQSLSKTMPVNDDSKLNDSTTTSSGGQKQEDTADTTDKADTAEEAAANQHHENGDAVKSTTTTTPAKRRRGRPPGSMKKQNTSSSSNSHLGKRQAPVDQQDSEKEQMKTEQAASPPPPAAAKAKRKRQRRTTPSFEPHTTRGRSKKLGDHQCFICGDTFFDLGSRDRHAEVEHPGASQWVH